MLAIPSLSWSSSQASPKMKLLVRGEETRERRSRGRGVGGEGERECICYDLWVFAAVANTHFSIYGYLLPETGLFTRLMLAP